MRYAAPSAPASSEFVSIRRKRMGQVYTRHVPPHTGRSERAAPVDVDAVVLGNRHLSADYNVLALDAPGDRRAHATWAVRDDQGLARAGPAAAAAILGVRNPSQRRRPVRSGISIFNKRAGVGTSLLSELETGARLQCLGPLGQPFTPIDPPAEAWMVAGGVGLAPFLTLAEALAARKTPTTLFYGARTGGRAVLRRPVRSAGRPDGARNRGWKHAG